MEKTRKTIQVLFRIGKVLCRIAMICCIVGACLCLVGIAALALGAEGDLRIGDMTIHGIIENSAGLSTGQLYIAMTVAMITLAGEAVVAGFGSRYFHNELIEGTPFTLTGAKEMLRLGIIAVAVSLGCSVIAETVASIQEEMFQTTAVQGHLGFDSVISAGVLFIIMSVILKYGAELTQGSRE